jgi:uncharacterized membrane protein YfhO
MASPSFDPAQTAILAAGKKIDTSPADKPHVTVETYEPEKIILRASLHAPGYLVLSDTWYPGWRATVDGMPATIERANVHFRAINLPTGTHTVHLVYEPASYFVGIGISAVTMLSIVLGTMIKLWTSKHGYIWQTFVINSIR